MKLPPLKIGELEAKVPIIQGGMGIGVSRHSLASAVSREGGIGVISAAQVGYDEQEFEKDPLSSNIKALKNEIKLALDESNGGVIGVNIMVAMNNYDVMVKTAAESGAHIIISGAGLPTELPKFVEGTNCKLAPIVSSPRAAALIMKVWDKRYKRVPDLIIVEGPKAGGHLGFHTEELDKYNDNGVSFKNLVKEIIDETAIYEEKYKRKIPVVAAGGVFTGKDIAEYIKLGAAGVQMATRFVATEECDAHINFKNAYVNASKDDIKIIKSPVGMPGRAIKNKFLENYLELGKTTKCYGCIKGCNPNKTVYCISKALIEAVKGNVDNGLIFAGDNVYRINKIVKVRELMDELVKEAESCL